MFFLKHAYLSANEWNVNVHCHCRLLLPICVCESVPWSKANTSKSVGSFGTFLSLSCPFNGYVCVCVCVGEEDNHWHLSRRNVSVVWQPFVFVYRTHSLASGAAQEIANRLKKLQSSVVVVMETIESARMKDAAKKDCSPYGHTQAQAEWSVGKRQSLTVQSGYCVGYRYHYGNDNEPLCCLLLAALVAQLSLMI